MQKRLSAINETTNGDLNTKENETTICQLCLFSISLFQLTEFQVVCYHIELNVISMEKC